MIGAQASNDQLEKILSYIQIGQDEGAEVVCGGEQVDLGGDLSEGAYYVQPTIFEGRTRCGSSRRRSSGRWCRSRPSRTSTTRCIANDTLYGWAQVWSRNINTACRGRTIQAGRVWTNCYHAYPAHAAFGRYKGRASAGRTTCACSSTTSRPRTCWSATPQKRWASSKCPAGLMSPKEAADMLHVASSAKPDRSCSTSPAAAATAVPRCATRPGFLVTEVRMCCGGVLDVDGVGDVPVYMSAPQYSTGSTPT